VKSPNNKIIIQGGIMTSIRALKGFRRGMLANYTLTSTKNDKGLSLLLTGVGDESLVKSIYVVGANSTKIGWWGINRRETDALLEKVRAFPKVAGLLLFYNEKLGYTFALHLNNSTIHSIEWLLEPVKYERCYKPTEAMFLKLIELDEPIITRIEDTHFFPFLSSLYSKK